MVNYYYHLPYKEFFKIIFDHSSTYGFRIKHTPYLQEDFRFQTFLRRMREYKEYEASLFESDKDWLRNFEKECWKDQEIEEDKILDTWASHPKNKHIVDYFNSLTGLDLAIMHQLYDHAITSTPYCKQDPFALGYFQRFRSKNKDSFRNYEKEAREFIKENNLKEWKVPKNYELLEECSSKSFRTIWCS